MAEMITVIVILVCAGIFAFWHLFSVFFGKPGKCNSCIGCVTSNSSKPNNNNVSSLCSGDCSSCPFATDKKEENLDE